MSDTSDRSEVFPALFADVVKALKPHTLGEVALRIRSDQQAWVRSRMTDGRFLSVEIVTADSTISGSETSGQWLDWTPTP